MCVKIYVCCYHILSDVRNVFNRYKKCHIEKTLVCREVTTQCHKEKEHFHFLFNFLKNF